MGIARTRLKEGDPVEVLPLEMIRQTLDARGRHEKLLFMPGMEKFAGRRFTVLKKVRNVFDERAWKMVRLKNTVLLKDAICDGTDPGGAERCHRRCFYYWKEEWVRKVSISSRDDRTPD